MDPDRARAELPAVEHEVVGLAAHGHRVGLEPVEVVGVRPGEGVVGRLRRARRRRRRRRTSGSRRPTRSGTGPSDTGGRPSWLRSPPSTSQVVCHSSATSEEEVAGARRRCARRSAAISASREELRHRRLDGAAVLHPHPHEALGAERLGVVGEGVELLAADGRPAPATRRPLIAAADANALNSVRGEHVGQLDQLHAEAEVGLVGAVAVHGLVPGDPGDLRRAASPVTASAASSTDSEMAASTSSWSTKLISASSCMNSYWRSARRSSSRRQRAIW